MDESYVDALIYEAMLPICPSVSKNVCREDPLPDEFIVHDSEDDRPDLYAGDRDVGITFYRRVHLYTRWDPQPKAKQIRQALRQCGFTITGNSEMDDKDGFTHKIVFAYIQGHMDE